MMKIRLIGECCLMLSIKNLSARTTDVVDYIRPIIGASISTDAAKSGHGLGKTFPGSATPSGLVQLNSDTEIAEAGYYSVRLDDYDVKVELSSLSRAGVLESNNPVRQRLLFGQRVYSDSAQ